MFCRRCPQYELVESTNGAIDPHPRLCTFLEGCNGNHVSAHLDGSNQGHATEYSAVEYHLVGSILTDRGYLRVAIMSLGNGETWFVRLNALLLPFSGLLKRF
ncbi:hypothetical protein VFPPC_15981 [Pochonia chlamydosporia 170]|uniref:Uncharacterized protein n=1 Tax=Pochonia chlamydosporia 170 TaxID=1380566 RepID=A0A179FKD1_METCM|nr:hypothetical protein VFPPC_15981 [Pochonia chlamydosporia 170]OAQ66075.1 hypothetical protein VFPPC_15981 [Pochonia chlamydosporia 170]